MKRRVVTILLFLLLGAAVNVAVAWGCVPRSRPSLPAMMRPPDEADLSWWSARAPQGFPDRPSYVVEFRAVGLTTTVMQERTPSPSDKYWSFVQIPNPPNDHVIRIRAGWPARSLEMSKWIEYPLTRVFRQDCIEYPIGRLPVLRLRAAPIRPIWPSFAYNTVFYAIILWLPVHGLFVLRRHVRHKHGHCLKCGYDLRGEYDAGCPECGWNREGATT
ncbi:MAG: hypothetical protein JSV91_14145 [Phycisphaerales bacterium]|nr:MAG: hypothetical protein JSV91_14145 [Phycisphaerales bacterium]